MFKILVYSVFTKSYVKGKSEVRAASKKWTNIKPCKLVKCIESKHLGHMEDKSCGQKKQSFCLKNSEKMPREYVSMLSL